MRQFNDRMIEDYWLTVVECRDAPEDAEHPRSVFAGAVPDDGRLAEEERRALARRLRLFSRERGGLRARILRRHWQ